MVTILILIDGFLQWDNMGNHRQPYTSHNPYFNRWFSAIKAAYDTPCGSIALSQSLF